MRKSVCLITMMSLLLLIAPQMTNAQSKVLMLVDPSAAWHPDSELELVDFLESSGYSVTVQPVAEVPGEDQIIAAQDYDVVYMADSIGSTTVSDGADIYLKDVEIPVISQEAYMWDEAEWTGRLQFEDFGDTFQALDDKALGAFTALDIVNPGHPMAAGLTGTVEIYTDPYGYNFGFVEQMGPGVDVIATIPGAPEYATLFVYEKGAELAEGTITAGMRIGMFIGQNVAREEFGGDGTNNRWDRLTPDGMNLVKAAFDYATGKIGGGITGDFDGSGVLDAADIDDLTSKSASGQHPSDYDLTNDALVNDQDVGFWISDLYNSWVGDANLDGEFSSSDLVAVLGSGSYETGAASVWSSGDFNGDGFTNSGDLVAALSAGGYELGPRAAVAAVPEPSSLTIIAVGLLVLTRKSRAKMTV